MSFRSDARPRSRWMRKTLWAMLAASALTVSTMAAAPAATAADLDLGPTLVETGTAPSGYAVKFRYQAPEGVQQVHVYGDWTYSAPENVTCDGCGDGRLPWDWRPGDVAATQWRTIAMTKGDDGIWETTVPLPAGTFRYAFTHDCASDVATGCTLNYDPANPWDIFPQYPGAPGAVRSTYWVPANPAFPTYDTDYQKPLPDDQMGTLQSIRYDSPLSTNPAGVHDMVVYTPAGYDPHREQPYPTLYISHGSGDHSTAWPMQGVAHYIVQNAINDGAAPEMVVVSTDFNGLPGGNNGYANELRNNVIPYLENNFNVSTDAADRAFGGFSAGGSRAASILYDHTDLFGYHAVWSWAPPAANDAQIERMKGVAGGIMIGTGLQDRLANIATNVLARVETLKAAGVDLTAHNVPGGHTWHAWRPLLDFYIRNVAFHAPADKDGIPIEAEITDQPGALTLTVGDYGDAVQLGNETTTGDRIGFTGSLPGITITDSRNATQAAGGGWSATGQSTPFTSGTTRYGGEHLGWTPRLTTPKNGVTPGNAVATALSDGPGLATPSALATASNEARRGDTTVTADLQLELPVDATAGKYTGALTVSLFPTD